MTTNFPAALDNFTNPTATDTLNSVTVPHADQHANANDAIEALQAKVGVDDSDNPASLDYRVAALEAGGAGGGDAYTNATAVPATIGGIAAGSTFTGKTMQEMWDALLYPYQAPSFSSFSISGQSTTLEVGDSVQAGSKTFSWATSNSGNITADSISISDVTGSVSLATGLANDGSESITIGAVTKSSATSNVWRITGTNSQAANFTRDFTVNWRWRLYYGESASTTLDESAIEALRVGTLATTANATYAFAATGYKWLCYPTAFGLKTTFKDTATNLDVAMQPAITVSVTNAFGVTTNYYCHRTLNQLGGAINIQVS